MFKNKKSAKRSAPGSEAARDKWPLQKNDFMEKNLPHAAKLPRTSGFFKKNNFLTKVLPQAAKLPGTSGLFKKSMFWKKFRPRQRSCPGQVACSKKNSFLEKSSAPGRSCPRQVARSRESEQPLQPRAWSAFWGVWGAEPPGKARGCGGAQPPHLPPPILSQIYS